MLVITNLLIIILGKKYYNEKERRKIKGEYAWFDVYYITTHWYNNCYAFTQQVFIFLLHIFALVFEVLLWLCVLRLPLQVLKIQYYSPKTIRPIETKFGRKWSLFIFIVPIWIQNGRNKRLQSAKMVFCVMLTYLVLLLPFLV